MTPLRAISAGYAVPHRDFEAVIHSVFAQAANLRPVNGTRLLTLVTADCSDLPQGIRIATPQEFSFENMLAQGEKIICVGSMLKDEQGCLSVDMHKATRWQCRLPALTEMTFSVAAAWTSVWQALKERQNRAGTEFQAVGLFLPGEIGQSVLTCRIRSLVNELISAARLLDPIPAAAVAALIGLGPGLTPEGDDFLVGFLTGLRCMVGGDEIRLKWLSAVGKVVIRYSRRTNDISRTYLYHASHGQVAGSLSALAGAIAGGETPDHILPIAEEAMRFGHSSGMTTVAGLLVGLSAWDMGCGVTRASAEVFEP